MEGKGRNEEEGVLENLFRVETEEGKDEANKPAKGSCRGAGMMGFQMGRGKAWGIDGQACIL